MELLLHRPQKALGVIAHPRGAGNEGITKIQALCEKHLIPFEIQDKAFGRIGAREIDYAVGVFKKVEVRLDRAGDHVVLVTPGGMGNLGTILRTMLGFNFQDLAIIQPAADIFHPDTVRASMGALFQLRYQRFDSFKQYQKIYDRNFYCMMTDGRVNLWDVAFESPFGLIFGNESSGLPEVFNSTGTSVKIHQSNKIDSFNLAVSLGVTLYEARNKER
jgi:TrmH family RNA methyltransferase